MNEGWSQLITLWVIFAMFALAHVRPRWRGTGTAHGTASWATEREMSRNGMFRGKGLMLGRTTAGARLIFLPRYCHVLLVGGTGSGKGVSVIIPQLRTYANSLFCFDVKGDLTALTAEHRARMGQRIIDLAPFAGGKDALNVLDMVQPGPMLVDQARAIAEALVVRHGSEPDPHWNESAVMVITGILVFVLLRVKDNERNLNAVREISSNPSLLDTAADGLIAMHGIPARLGHHIKGLQDKEKSGVLSTVGRHLAFLDSELVASAVAASTFEPTDLCRAGTTVYLRIPPDQLEPARGLLRCWMSALIRQVAAAGNESSEVLFLIDEASALGASLPAIEEALVRGRSAGVRLLLAYQSDSQVRAAFPTKPTLIYDNCDAQIFLGANSYELAERISKMIGDETLTIESAGHNESQSWQTAGQGENGQANRSWSRNWAEHGRALMKPEEILTMSTDHLIAFVRGMHPILARRVFYFADPAFGTAFWLPPPMWWLLLLASLGLVAWAAIVAQTF